MKKLESHNIAAEFAPDSRSDFGPVSPGRLRATGIDALEKLKQRLVQETASAKSDATALSWLRQAAEACIRSQRQRDTRQRSLGLIGLDG